MNNGIFKKIKPFLAKNEPEILMSMGIGGMIFSTIWAVKATFNVVRKIDAKKEELNKDKLSFKETLHISWRDYLPVVVGTAISVPCIILGNNVSSKRTAAIATAYTISETALQEYREQTKEIVGAKKEQEIHEGISQKRVDKTYNDSTVVLTGAGDSLFYEPITGRYFKSNWNKITKCANELNSESISNISGVITLAEWFEAIGLKPTDISDTLGWSVLDHGQEGIIDISIDATLTVDNEPCGAIYYKNEPKPLH